MSQAEEIYLYLKRGNSLTPLDALKAFGCFRLGARIYELRREGHNIITKYKKANGKVFAEYRMEN